MAGDKIAVLGRCGVGDPEAPLEARPCVMVGIPVRANNQNERCWSEDDMGRGKVIPSADVAEAFIQVHTKVLR